MARVDYAQAPSEAPEIQAPEDLSHVQSSPASFGAATAEGLQQAGKGALDLSEFYGRVSANNAVNNAMDQARYVLHGNPSQPMLDSNGQPVLGPDGKPMPDTGFLGRHGADAMSAYGSASERLDEIIQEQEENLKTPASRLQYQTESRRMRNAWAESMAGHYDQQTQVYAEDTSNTTVALNQSAVADNLNNPGALFNAWEGIRHGVTDLDVHRYGDTPDVRSGAILKADQIFYTTQIDAALGNNDPDRAKLALDQGASSLASSPRYPELASKVRTAVADKASIELSDAATASDLGQATAASKANVGAGIPATATTGPIYDRIAATAKARGATADEISFLQRQAYIESRGDPNAQNGQSTGLFQFHPDTFTGLGGTNIHDPDQQTVAALKAERQNAAILQGANVPVSDPNLYILHQQGPAGGRAIVSAPQDESVVQALAAGPYHGNTARATAAIAGNIGMPYRTPEERAAADEAAGKMTAGQFVSLWNGKFGGGAVGGDAATSSTARYLLEHEADNFAAFKAKVEADPRLANDPRGQEMAIDRHTRDYHAMIDQQEAQYKADSMAVIQASAGAHSWADVERNLGQDGPALIARFPGENPYAWSSMDNKFDKEAEGKAQTYGANFSSYLSRALAPADDPSRISNPMQLNPFLGAGKDAAITTEGQRAIAQITALRGSPEGEAFAAQARTIMAQMHGDLTFSSGPAGTFDPKGEQLYSQFSAVALPILLKSYQAGTLNQVLDPNSPDYIGKVAQPFERSPAKIIRDRLDMRLADYQGQSEAEMRDALLRDAYNRGRMSAGEANRREEGGQRVDRMPAGLTAQLNAAKTPEAGWALLQASVRAGNLEPHAAVRVGIERGYVPKGTAAPVGGGFGVPIPSVSPQVVAAERDEGAE